MKYLITVSSIIELIYFDPRGIEIGHWFFFPVWVTIPPKVAANCSLQYTFSPRRCIACKPVIVKVIPSICYLFN